VIPSIIFAVSIGTLLEFGATYCRSLLMVCSKVELSDALRELSGLDPHNLERSDFDYLLQLVRLAPNLDSDTGEMRAVTLYYRAACFAAKLMSPFSKRVSDWFEEEFSRCAHFAAVALDRRLASIPR